MGTRFDAAQGVEGAWLKLPGKAHGAMHGARRRCGLLGVGAADLQLHLFEALSSSIQTENFSMNRPG